MANDPRRYPFDFDRARGIFTPRDRQFLAGEIDDELTENAQRQKRYQLRQRVANAIEDLAYLAWMDPDDISQVIRGFDEKIAPDPEEDVIPLPDDVERRLVRIDRGAEAISRIYHELLFEDAFYWILERQFGIHAALSHYEETGKVGLFNVDITVELEDEMTIEELQDVERGAPVFDYSGVGEVLDRYGPEEWRERDLPVGQLSTDSGGLPEQLEPVADAYAKVSGDESPPDRGEVARAIAEAEDVSHSKAEDLIEAALLAGHCYEPEDGKLTWV